MSELRTDSREWVHRIMGSLDRMLVGLENLAVGNRPVLGGERYLTDKEVSAQLKLSRRTLQDYRNEGRISALKFSGKLSGSKVPSSDCPRTGYARSSPETITKPLFAPILNTK